MEFVLGVALGVWLGLYVSGYTVRGWIAEAIRLATYRLGLCQCGLCKPRERK